MELCVICKKRRRMLRQTRNGRKDYRTKCSGCHKQPYKRFKKDKCDFCGFIPVHICQLDVDHIDGNHSNDDPANLQTLCANCHRLKTFTQMHINPPLSAIIKS